MAEVQNFVRKIVKLTVHYFPYDVKLRLLAHSRSFLANQKARNAIVGAENLLKWRAQSNRPAYPYDCIRWVFMLAVKKINCCIMLA